jgi:ubiquinone/menaquinone biosynthesis C-methylase UbiE
MGCHVCPWWKGYFLIGPVRRIQINPEKIIKPYVREGMKVLEVGPGMGFFSIPLARGVGKSGHIYSVDIQEKMLTALRNRAQKAKVADIVETRLCPESSLQIGDLTGTIDFILAFAVVHEVPSQENLFTELYSALKKEGLLLVAEPKKRVREKDYNGSLAIAKNSGFKIKDTPVIPKNYATLLMK